MGNFDPPGDDHAHHQSSSAVVIDVTRTPSEMYETARFAKRLFERIPFCYVPHVTLFLFLDVVPVAGAGPRLGSVTSPVAVETDDIGENVVWFIDAIKQFCLRWGLGKRGLFGKRDDGCLLTFNKMYFGYSVV